MLKLLRVLLAMSVFTLAGAASAQDHDAPNYLTNAQLSALKNAASVVEGASGSKVKTTLYVFMDPNCIFCHFAWKGLQPYEAVGLQVHWIPLGFLKADSPGKAAALLQSTDGAALLHQLETRYSEKDESGGIAPLNPIPPQAQAKLDANTKLFSSLGFDATPTLIYKTRDGRWASLGGLPHLSDLPGYLDLPAQPIDASLEKFR